MQKKHLTRCLFITAIDFADAFNGGALCVRNQLEELSRVLGIQVIALGIGSEKTRDARQEICSQIGVEFIAIDLGAYPPTKKLSPDIEKIPFTRYEVWAGKRPEIANYINDFVQSRSINKVVFSDLRSAFFADFNRLSAIKKIIYVQNEESRFQSNRLTELDEDELQKSLKRFREVEREIYSKMDYTILLSKADLPEHADPTSKFVILPPRPFVLNSKWQTGSAVRYVFIGGDSHVLNADAYHWIRENFVNHLTKLSSRAELVCVGEVSLTTQNLFKDFRQSVKFVGRLSEQKLEDICINGGVLLAPIWNRFGAKMKVLKAISLGMPILGTRGAFSGVPWYDRFEACLENDASVPTKLQLFADMQFLKKLSEDTVAATRAYMTNRDTKFPRFITES